MQKLTVLVITHKDYEFPTSACYRPIFVGKRANALKNISIPRFESTIKVISEALEEKEREEFTRQKVIKEMKR